MHGDEHHITVLIGKLYNFPYPAHIVPHAHETSENTYSMVYVHYVVSHIESTQIIERKLFALVYGTP